MIFFHFCESRYNFCFVFLLLLLFVRFLFCFVLFFAGVGEEGGGASVGIQLGMFDYRSLFFI